MAGFTQRFSSFPGVERITAIEGVIVIEPPPPGQIAGVPQDVVCCVGEFPDLRNAVQVDPLTGIVTTKGQPVEIFSAQDLANKLGLIENSYTIGEFAKAMGNGLIDLANKRFSRLVAVPINQASGFGGRLWRELPTNTSATDARPVVPLAQGVVLAGREFRTGGGVRVLLGRRTTFTDLVAYRSAIDGVVVPVGLPAPTQTFDSASSTFITTGVKEGDILVVGVIGGAGALGTDARTYRVVSVATETQLVIERMDGTDFAVGNWVAGVALPFRLHVSSTADTGEDHQFSEAPGYLVPVRQLTAPAVAMATLLAPQNPAAAGTATTWDPLSGLAMRSHVTGGFTFDVNVQGPNAANHASIQALYKSALESLLTDAAPGSEVTHVWSARKARGIANELRQHELTANARGMFRTVGVSPGLDLVSNALAEATTSIVATDTQFGVGDSSAAGRDESIDFHWPGVLTFVPSAVGQAIPKVGGGTTLDGILDVSFEAFVASLISFLPPERNPGQAAEPVPTVFAPILALQRGLPTEFGINEYTRFRSVGIAAPRIDKTTGPILQSGITTSLTAGQKNINRRRMANFIEASLARAYQNFVKLPLTDALKDAILGQTVAFLEGLKSPDNPSAQRIVDYQVDGTNGNTPELEAQGIYVVIVKVRTLATADFIVLNAQIGEGVEITVSSLAA